METKPLASFMFMAQWVSEHLPSLGIALSTEYLDTRKLNSKTPRLLKINRHCYHEFDTLYQEVDGERIFETVF
jgi:hypothetical protein